MDNIGTMKMGKALHEQGALTALSKYYGLSELEQFFRLPEGNNAFFSMGNSQADLDKLRALSSKVPISKICVEIANGYIADLPKFVGTIRNENPDSIIMAGSVCTPDMTVNLLKSGADIIRVGIGSGSVCTTRKVVGVGYPQLSAVLECAEAAHEAKGHLCSDGGCTVPGDVCKALGAGADLVMLGGMLAGHDECEGSITYVTREGREIPVSMQFYGMASRVAQEKHHGGLASYRAAEGKVVDVPYRGCVRETMDEIVGGVRSMMTYVDARSISDVAQNTTFVRVNNQTNNVYGR
jgi:GMP reductase